MQKEKQKQVHVKYTFIASPIENGLENCIDKPLSTFPRMSLAAKAVATPASKIIKISDRFEDGKHVPCTIFVF